MSSESSELRTARAKSRSKAPARAKTPSRPSTPAASPELIKSRPLPSTSKEDSPPIQSKPLPTIILRTKMSDTHKEVSTKLNTKNLEFTGKKAEFRAWKDTIDLYMIGNPSQFPSDQRKIAFALSWICGSRDAKIWASNKQGEFSDDEDWGTWEAFEATLEDAFGDPAAETQAQEYLVNFRQGNQKARPFFTTLELWFNLARITDSAQQHAIAT